MAGFSLGKMMLSEAKVQLLEIEDVTEAIWKGKLRQERAPKDKAYELILAMQKLDKETKKKQKRRCAGKRGRPVDAPSDEHDDGGGGGDGADAEDEDAELIDHEPLYPPAAAELGEPALAEPAEAAHAAELPAAVGD